MSFKPIFFLWVLSISIAGQSKTIIYCFPGEGSDRHLFDSLKLDSQFEIKVIEYGIPAKGETMDEFAKHYIQQIDTSKPFILLGVSLGGMICVELNEIMNPQKTIIISSALNRNELPVRYRFQRRIPLYRLFTPRSLYTGAKLMQPLVEPDRNKYKSTFKGMLYSKDPIYIKRSIGLIINWERTSNSKPVYHIHGSNDHTLPIKCIKSKVYSVKGGSHMMTLTRHGEISGIINSILED
jgi:pimeloyl-ACP methyl ester carboxylesterase